MNRRDTLRRLLVAGQVPVWLLLAYLCVLAGCNTPLTRGKSDEETERDLFDSVKVIRNFTTVGNSEPISVGGVGLVTGLDGTGGESPPDSYRTMLEDQLRKAGCKDVKHLLASPENAVVIVIAKIPPGTQAGDPFDVEVMLPRGSKATSLRGGTLEKCKLFTYAQASALRGDVSGSGNLILGHPIATAEGPLLVGLGYDKDEDEARLKNAHIWNGGHSKVPAVLRLILNADKQHASLAGAIANRINETFPGAGVDSNPIAVAHDNHGIELNVPASYRLNVPHFLRVVLFVPLHAPGDVTTSESGLTYRQRLAADLLDPARTVVAALRLEALGDSSVPVLREGMKSKDVMVRFSSAESLAYLGNPAGAQELATIVVQQPYLRAFALTALASLRHEVTYDLLRNILTASGQDEVRYGAFRALLALKDKDPAVKGELLNDSFWLHKVATKAEPLIHVSSAKRPEIVLFGGDSIMTVPFGLRAGEYLVTATEDDRDHCLVTWVPMQGGDPVRAECPLRVEAVLRQLAKMGASYAEAVEILQQADMTKCLSCRLRADALPQSVSVEELAAAGKKKVGEEGADVLLVDPEIGATPTLFDSHRPLRANPFRDAGAIEQEHKPDRVIGDD
jgi:hypothetical protein